MTVSLTSITFNTDPTRAVNDAMNIRRNADVEVCLPEWKADRSVKPEDSPAAYSILDTAGRQPVFIDVAVESSSTVAHSIEIQATGGGLLGPVSWGPFEVGGDGDGMPVRIPLAERSVFRLVGVEDIAWAWSYREGGGDGAWIPLTTTRHRIYLVLAVPASPWVQEYPSNANPWTDLLDLTCVLAMDTIDGPDATTAIMQAIYSRYNLKYDICKGKNRYLRSGPFELSRWMKEVLHGDRTCAPYMPDCPDECYYNDWIVNCQDCGTALTVMARSVGATTAYRTQSPFGFLNLVRPIGRGVTNNPFYGCDGPPIVPPGEQNSSFGMHAYAAIGGRVSDACLQVDLPTHTQWALRIAWWLIFVASMGTVRFRSLELLADGWLAGVPTVQYEGLVIQPDVRNQSTLPGTAGPDPVTIN